MTRLWGSLLIATGVLIVLLCGGCSVTVFVSSVWNALAYGGPSAGQVVLTTLIAVAIIGGLPTAAGGFLVWAGLRVVRPRPPGGPAG
jgi:hypothetical protein